MALTSSATYSYDHVNRLTSSVATGSSTHNLTFSYDLAGDVLGDGSLSYTWDGESRMKTAGSTTYVYDGDGKRVERGTSKLYWYGLSSDPLAESDGAGSITNEFIFFNSKRIARRDNLGNVFYYLGDHLGTSRVIVQAGQTTPCYDADYYPFGGENVFVNTCPQNYKFTGKERDAESGLDNFGARYNSSQFGRFTSPDPGPWLLANPQNLNAYTHVLNNPLRYTG
jgi:RHS repeat-associated protein